jgi:hypothetical protein
MARASQTKCATLLAPEYESLSGRLGLFIRYSGSRERDRAQSQAGSLLPVEDKATEVLEMRNARTYFASLD